ncbi:hypothetical protein [Methylobacterium sp. J-092]|uniref:hypothetical protein n=1 Tax=Methylobacterium sp. J-092 TaxID=2836667 RepID=UPI001FBA4938|nr:hypothetical protein [Methylobacterium sp. J-092]MCJ2006262.1 hypothetical protein [Methylobacterium sp. J-092]
MNANPSAIRGGPSMDPGNIAASQGSDEGPAFGFDPGAGIDDEPFLPFTLGAREHSGLVSAKEMMPDPSSMDGACEADLDASPSLPPPPLTPAVDTGSGDRLPRAGTPAGPGRRVPPRVAARPRTEEWADDELLTLPEAAALFWPAGPITTNTLRTAERDGTLTVTKVAGKFFTTPMAIRRMGVDEVGEKAGEPDRAEASPQAMFQLKLAEARRLGRDRKRTARAAKRSALPSA